MQLCFVSVHGPRETYFVDEPRMYVTVMTADESCEDVTFRVTAFINTPTKHSLCVCVCPRTKMATVFNFQDQATNQKTTEKCISS
jgi:hypothetical protein